MSNDKPPRRLGLVHRKPNIYTYDFCFVLEIASIALENTPTTKGSTVINTVSSSCDCFSVDIVQRINRSLESGTQEETHNLLQKPEGRFPTVLKRSALLYHDGLLKVKQRELQVRVSYLLKFF